MSGICGIDYVAVFDGSDVLFVFLPTSCDVGYKYGVGFADYGQAFW